ncbi:unnamed protein product [Strongylus vulgaris]|uniref:Uncharacterized protein n=1 Tax=Strongylus vulgaris TaxID=40348 RepID=A0A3P7IN78_STRVU|nr:unnamed protein product [Strongylus vulgaris]
MVRKSRQYLVRGVLSMYHRAKQAPAAHTSLALVGMMLRCWHGFENSGTDR